MGRNLLYSEQLKEEFLEAILAGLTERDAAWACGFSEDTLTRWKRGEQGAPEDFSDQLRQTKARRALQWLNIVRRKAAGRMDPKTKKWVMEPNLSAALELIDRCAPEYRKNPRSEMTIHPGAPPTHADLLASVNFDRLTPQEQFQFAELLDKLSGADMSLPAHVLDADVSEPERSDGS